MRVTAYCLECSRKHVIDFDPLVPTPAFRDWYAKHSGHAGVGFDWPGRVVKPSWVDRLRLTWRWFARPGGGLSAFPRGGERWLLPAAFAALLPNANINVAYAASTSPTMTLASLAASSNLLAGRESTAVDNGTTKYLDYLLAGHYRTGAANLQAGRIRTGLVGARDDTPSWPDVFDGTDSTETVTVQAMYDSVVRIASEVVTDATQRTWPFGPVAIAGLWGGALPDQFVLFTSHSAHTSTNVWSATEGDHSVRLTGIYATVA